MCIRDRHRVRVKPSAPLAEADLRRWDSARKLALGNHGPRRHRDRQTRAWRAAPVGRGPCVRPVEGTGAGEGRHTARPLPDQWLFSELDPANRWSKRHVSNVAFAWRAFYDAGVPDSAHWNPGAPFSKIADTNSTNGSSPSLRIVCTASS